MKSDVAFVHKNFLNKDDFFSSVERTMNLANWKKHISGKNVFLKINALSPKVVPGQNTSPWFVEAVADVFYNNGFKIFIGDADVATAKQVELSAKNWGYSKLCLKYKTRFVNLSKHRTLPVRIKGRIFSVLRIPKILFNVDSLITLPVVKTHNVAGMTCALKNQWGCIPRFRQKYHLILSHAIPEINMAVPTSFCVADASICLEDNGPVTGMPRVTNSFFASDDLVALDSAVAAFIGYDSSNFGYIVNSEKIGLGTRNFNIIGDKFVFFKFRPALACNHPIVSWELRLRKTKGLNKLLFETPLFKIPAWCAYKYNSVWWYNKYGKKYARRILRNYPLYREEFRGLVR
ncbi:MAG: DUF362 domain-containing protein [Candidatus Nanoarchaeia archaeon]